MCTYGARNCTHTTGNEPYVLGMGKNEIIKAKSSNGVSSISKQEQPVTAGQ